MYKNVSRGDKIQSLKNQLIEKQAERKGKKEQRTDGTNRKQLAKSSIFNPAI